MGRLRQAKPCKCGQSWTLRFSDGYRCGGCRVLVPETDMAEPVPAASSWTDARHWSDKDTDK